MKQHFRVIQLHNIDETRTYDLHPFLDETPLDFSIAQSIKLVGLLSPPVIIEKTGGKFEIICGRQRIHYIRSLHIGSCCCQLLEKHCSAEKILTIIIEDQFTKGPLTVIEQACFIKICRELLADEKSQNIFFESLLPGRITKGIRYLAQLAELEHSIQSAIHSGIISEKIITELLKFGTNDQKILLSFIRSLNLGGNNQKKLLGQLVDILKRNSISLASFIDSEEVQEVLTNKDLHQNDKASKLLHYIRRLHKPLLTASQDSFDRQLKAMDLPNNLTIRPSDSFEKNDITMSVRFSSLDEFKRKWKNIEKYLSD